MVEALSRRKLLREAAAGAVGLLTGSLLGCGEPEVRGEPTRPFTSTMPAIAADGTATNAPTTTPSPTPGSRRDPNSLRELATRIGFDIGTEVNGVGFSQHPEYRKVISEQFNLLVLDWGVYWRASEPQRNSFDFRVVDKTLPFAESNGAKARGHALVFPSMGPSWVNQGTFSASELTEVMRNHVTTLVSKYRGRIAEWVVVNEWGHSPQITNDIFYNTIGSNYIDICFETARAADPSAKLILNNNHNHSSDGFFRATTKETVDRLRSKGLVDIVGLQMHIDGMNPPEKGDVVKTMQSYGLPVAITEFDIDLEKISGNPGERFEYQAKIASEMLSAAIESGVCSSFTVWDVGDKYSWLKAARNEAHPDSAPFDENLNPKPEFYALQSALRARGSS